MELQKETIPQKYADEHTKWAYERTRLAKERTFAAWVRTGLSSIAVGLAIVKLLPSIQPRWLLHTIGIIFVGTGGTLFVLGYRTYRVVIKKLEQEGFKGIPTEIMGVLTAVFLLGAIFALVLIIMD
jgi:putative membrane protein